METQALSVTPTHVARLNGAEIRFAASAYDEVVPAFVEAQGGGVPQIVALARSDEDGTAQPLTRLVGHVPEDAVIGPFTRPDAIEVVETGERTPLPIRGQTIDTEGQLRSMFDDAAARQNGFSPRRPLYARGTMVVGLGVENAREARADHDKMPSVDAACDGFLADFAKEQRRDVNIEKPSVRMDKDGRLAIYNERLPVSERAFGSFCWRMGFGGGDYLSRCWPELRAINVNRWADSFAKAELAKLAEWQTKGRQGDAPTPDVLSLRTRKAAKSEAREVYGVVSDSYTPFDADKVAQALRLAMPEDAKLRVQYDGFRSRFDVLFHTTVQPEKFVAGEFFRAGITIRTDDTGGGSLRGSSFVEQNLCLNLIILDKATQPLFAIRHMGSVERLAQEFREGLDRAKETLASFLAQWGYAKEDDLVAAAVARGELETLIPVTEAIEGLFNGVIERDLVPLRARRTETLSDLSRMYFDDTSSDGPTAGRITRAGLVNAFTRYAHVVEEDPWKGAEIERTASALLFPKRGNRLVEIPYEAVEA